MMVMAARYDASVALEGSHRMAKRKDKDRLDDKVSHLLTSVAHAASAQKERVEREAEEFDRDARDHFNDIRAGGRRFKRPFRP